MLKKFTTVFALILFVGGVVFAQSQPLTVDKAKVVNEDPALTSTFYSDYQNAKINKLNDDEMVFTDYDYPSNSETSPMITMGEVGGEIVPMWTAMQRLDAGTRNVVFGYTDIFGSNWIPAHDPTAATGWGMIQWLTTGPLAGNALLCGHSGGASSLFLVDPDALTASNQAGPFGGNFIRIARDAVT